MVKDKQIFNQAKKIKNPNIYLNYNKNLIFFFYYLNFIYLSLLISGQNIIAYSQINLIIEGNGTQQIFNPKSQEISFNLTVNGIDKGYIQHRHAYDFEDYLNNITIKFNESITNCSQMFFDSKNIILIDLSNFDASNVIDMRGMFYGCSKLTSIDLTNLNTSSVSYMNYTFYGCISLHSLNLSSFDTSNVITMDNMFKNCINLNYMDLSNFDTS